MRHHDLQITTIVLVYRSEKYSTGLVVLSHYTFNIVSSSYISCVYVGFSMNSFLPGRLLQVSCHHKTSWRCRGLNPGPHTCKACALPLSYIPCTHNSKRQRRRAKTIIRKGHLDLPKLECSALSCKVIVYIKPELQVSGALRLLLACSRPCRDLFVP